MRYLYYLLLVLGLFSAISVTAQRRSVDDTRLLPEVQTEVALKGDDYLLVGLRTPLLTGTASGVEVDRVGLNVGYERFWTQQWSGGATLRAEFYDAYSRGGDVSKLYADVVPELFVRHWNILGGFNFRQRLGVEYYIPGGESSESRAITRLRLDMDRVIPLGEHTAIRPRIAYEAVAYLRLQRDETKLKERVIDFGSVRADVGVIVSPRFDFTPWVASQTNYLNALPQFDASGNQTRGGRTNIVSPVVGLDMRLTLFRGGVPFERRQLPTQH
ncbi:hypothetical protein [Hymenobacter volaticus]|uniref:DUF2490 domain-containing protein n=1 Tax=Hymenobacter volaticus TaxID=2932254 RepID=A0ABY4G405_9BACT|nr:hypothetical protein [Hymenobacter volaticus]UOQ65620.1 hypothetical protein MUN86_19080 [Hymenobacter volaticus]